MSASDINNNIFKDGVSPKTNDDVCEVNDMLQNMSTADNGDVSACASCGKEGSDNDMNTCNKCKMVKYCNATCKKKHRSKHKKQCERRVAKLHDEELFKQPPPREDCPICFILLPLLPSGHRYMSCCGKVICTGCYYAPVYDNKGDEVDNQKCAFCRTPFPKSDEVAVERLQKRMEVNDVQAMEDLGCCYRDGTNGFPQDYIKALELWHRASEVGSVEAYNAIGSAYEIGIGVEVDKKKATHYYELSAMGGSSPARHNLGNDEVREGKWKRAIKHYTIAARSGDNDSLSMIKQLFSRGYAEKDDYIKALQLYQTHLGEIKSRQRDTAAAAREDYRYY